VEGGKVLFRFGVALLVLYKMVSAEQLLTISNADDWWHGLRAWAHSNRFDFDYVVRKAYGVHGKGIRRQMRFPRRHILHRIIKIEEERLLEEDGDDEEYSRAPARPLGLATPYVFGKEEEAAVPVLVESTRARMQLAEWLPLTMRMTNLQLLYSTSHHGRSLDMFYKRVAHARHTILICEAYRHAPGAASSPHSPPQTTSVIGMYASQAWRVSNQVYGDGGCFLFRLEPDPACWKWKPRRPGDEVVAGSSLLDGVNLEDDLSENNQTALLEQFMVGTRAYISMGGNKDGSAGLRFNEDLTVGESSTAIGFENQPLHGLQCGSVFDVGLVEVYGFVRQMDGRAA